jgi:ubiquinone/menaquinone biosynthesis C-methylase UbiE
MTAPTPAGTALDELRAHVHAMWSTVAPGWAQQADYVAARGAAVTDIMIEAAELRPGDRVLELACGTGDVGIAAARRVGPSGHVVVTDVAAEMVAIAAGRVEQAQLTNVSTAVRDIEHVDEPDDAYDAVLCRDGLMFALDAQRGADEIHRVLRPGGRTVIVVWAERSRNPWLGLVFDAVTEQLGFPVPPPGIPGPFALGDSDQLQALLTSAGLVDVTVSEIPVPLHAPDFDTWFDRVAMLAGPLAKILASLGVEVRAALLARLRESVERYTTPDGIELPGLALLGSGRTTP